MGRIKLTKLSMLCLAGAVSVTAAGCSYHSAHPAPPPASHHYPSYYYDYYYYPDVDVYFHLYSGHYYYRRNGAWVSVDVLPPRIHLDRYHRVPLRIWHERPYVHHREHRKRYGHLRGYRADEYRGRSGSRDWDGTERRHNERRHDDYRERRDGRR